MSRFDLDGRCWWCGFHFNEPSPLTHRKRTSHEIGLVAEGMARSDLRRAYGGQPGYVIREKYRIGTPKGDRIADFAVLRNGKVVNLYEVKANGARRNGKQRWKDGYIAAHHGWRTTVLRYTVPTYVRRGSNLQA